MEIRNPYFTLFMVNLLFGSRGGVPCCCQNAGTSGVTEKTASLKLPAANEGSYRPLQGIPILKVRT
jgi:hypothetical protein